MAVNIMKNLQEPNYTQVVYKLLPELIIKTRKNAGTLRPDEAISLAEYADKTLTILEKLLDYTRHLRQTLLSYRRG